LKKKKEGHEKKAEGNWLESRSPPSCGTGHGPEAVKIGNTLETLRRKKGEVVEGNGLL